MRYKHPIFQHQEEGESDAPKISPLSLFVIGVLALLAGYTGWLQLYKSREMDAWARRQQDSIAIIPGRRGNLLDRNGTELNKSLPSYSLALHIERLRDPRDTQRRTLDKVCAAVSDLAAFLGPDFYHSRPTRQEARKHIQRNTPLPFILWKEVDKATIDKWAAARTQFPGTDLVLAWKRHYEFPHSASLLRGKTGFGAPIFLPEFKRYNLSHLDLSGKSGLELALNAKLSGTAGYEELRIDALAYRQETVSSSPATNGDDVTLTIDIALQQEIERLLRSQDLSGSVVLMDLRTSEILAAVSEPSFPLDGTGEPQAGSLVNRVLGGTYPPGSTLKPLVALAALQSGLVSTEERIDCPGFYALPDGRQVGCSKRSGHGALNLEEALAYSCNVFFCELGNRLGPLFDGVGAGTGLGEPPGTELRLQEKSGLRFTPEWVENHRFSLPKWTAGDAANAAIGQGAWLVSPMQLLIALAAVADGKRRQPTFILGDYQQPAERLDWDAEQLAAVQNGMLKCTEYGTGKTMQVPGFNVLAKTGTAEVGGGKRPHALAFAALPAEAPRLACICIIEHGGGGGKVAGPIVRQSIQAALQKGF